jgi:hypothetical protein
MAAVEPEKPRTGLMARAGDMLFRPQQTWAVIAREPAEVGDLYLRSVIPLAAIPALCDFLGIFIFGGLQIASIEFRPPLAGAAVEALANYGLTLALAYALARIVEVLSGRFGGVPDRVQAFKLVAYSGTAVWVLGALALYPALGIPAALLGAVYSLYLLYVGLPRLMRIEPGRAISCFALILLAVLAMAALKGLISAKALEVGGPLIAA